MMLLCLTQMHIKLAICTNIITIAMIIFIIIIILFDIFVCGRTNLNLFQLTLYRCRHLTNATLHYTFIAFAVIIRCKIFLTDVV